MHLN